MRNVLCIGLPSWPTDRMRRRLGRAGSAAREPLLLVRSVANRSEVAHCCGLAAREGVRAGMGLTHARALLSRPPIVQEHQPERDAAALRSLAQWALRLGPIVEPDPPDGLLLDVTGCERLYGGERRMLDRIADRIAGLGLEVRAALERVMHFRW